MCSIYAALTDALLMIYKVKDAYIFFMYLLDNYKIM